jgi:hypothetical protein
MTSVRVKLNQPPTTQAQYLNTVRYARKFDGAITSLLSPALADYPDMPGLTVGLIESGLTAWGVPEFEKCLKNILKDWAAEGLLIRTQLFAQWLLTTTDDRESQRWLMDFAKAQYWGYLNDYEFRCSVIGAERDYLYPLRVDRLIYARYHWGTYRTLQRMVLAGKR